MDRTPRGLAEWATLLARDTDVEILVGDENIKRVNRKRSGEVWIAINTTWNIYNFRGSLIRSLVEAGFHVGAYGPPDGYIDRVISTGARYIPMQFNNAGTNPVLELLTFARMVLLLRRERPALLLTYTPKVNIYMSLAARLNGVPVSAKTLRLSLSKAPGPV